MKRLTLKAMKLKSKMGLLLAIGLTISLSSCLKNNDDYVDQNFSALAVIHASPGLQPFDFVLDKQKINSDAFDYSERLNYFNIYSGNIAFGIFKTQTVDSIKTGILVAQPNKYYSVYVIGEASNPEFLTIADSLTAPKAGMAKVRFLNLSLNSPALNLSYGAESTLFSNTAYKAHSEFTEIEGGKNYSFTIENSSGEVKGSADNIPLQSGRIYTIWSTGIYNSTSENLKTGIKIQMND
ncbi:MAG: DUF4397 domain-containing protein [Pelobium sp.]